MNTHELLQKSKGLFEGKKYLIAKEYAQAALEQDENCIEALFALAQCDEALGKTQAMASSLFKVLSIDTSNVRAIEKLRNTGFLGKEKVNDEVELAEKILDDGSVYLLPMRGDKIEGFGALVKNDMFYAGMFKDNNMHGHGLMKGTNGSVFVGDFNQGSFERGTLINDNYQVKTTFNGSEPDGKSPVEMKWKNGNKVIFRLEKGSLEDINSWSDIKFFKADGTCYPIELKNGDSINLASGEVLTTQRPTISGSIDNVLKNPSATNNGFAYEMVYVEGGQFLFGAQSVNRYQPNYDPEATYREQVSQKTVRDFYIGKFLVTQKLWKEIMGDNPASNNKGDYFPIENVSNSEILEFIERIKHITGNKYRLPTNVEWEYVARGGKYCKGFKYPGSDSLDEVAWTGGFGNHEVGKKKPNELGVYDMLGNVCEVTADGYLRGGGRPVIDWYAYRLDRRRKLQYINLCRITAWTNSSLYKGDASVGFRLAMDL